MLDNFLLVVRLCCALDMFQGAPARCPDAIFGVFLTLTVDNDEFSHRGLSKKVSKLQVLE